MRSSYFPDLSRPRRQLRMALPKAGETNPSVSVWLAEVPGGKAAIRSRPEIERMVEGVRWPGRSVAVQTANRAQNRLKVSWWTTAARPPA